MKGTMARMTPEDMLKDVQESLAIRRRTYNYEPHDWFFPSDVHPHSNSFKYQCKKLHTLGMLERSAGFGRWGYTYRVPIGLKNG